jgi:hypothetical protein
MKAGKAIYGILSANAGVTAICSTRIYPDVAAQGSEFPFVVYNITRLAASDTKSGVSTLDEERYDINCVSSSYAQAIGLSEAVRGALDRYSGTVNGVAVQSIQFTDFETSFDDDNDVYVAVVEVVIRVKR